MGDVNHEPSMEEILASIKKIIAEDGDHAASDADVRPRRKSRAAVPETTPEPEMEAAEDDVLELTDAVGPEHDEPSAATAQDEQLVSQEAIQASQAALEALSAMTDPSSPATKPDDAHPLEGMVREMLRPMLKEWLDANLPALVEELVAREVARIAAPDAKARADWRRAIPLASGAAFRAPFHPAGERRRAW